MKASRGLHLLVVAISVGVLLSLTGCGRTAFRNAAVAGVAIFTGCILTSCDLIQFDTLPGGAAIGQEDRSLVIAICKTIDADSFVVSTRDLDGTQEWEDVWTFDGGGVLQAGTELSMDPSMPLRPGEVRADVDLSPGLEIAVRIRGADGAVVGPDFIVPEAGMPEDGWFQSDGQVSSAACPE